MRRTCTQVDEKQNPKYLYGLYFLLLILDISYFFKINHFKMLNQSVLKIRRSAVKWYDKRIFLNQIGHRSNKGNVIYIIINQYIAIVVSVFDFLHTQEMLPKY